MVSHEALRVQLEARLTHLTKRVAKIEEDLRRMPDPDSEERAIEAENDEVLEGLDARSIEEARQIKAAIARMDAGNYGVCTRCGEDIDARRLAAVPFAATCVACAG